MAIQKFADVNAFLGSLEPHRREQAETLRVLIMRIEPALGEHIKWNAPSYTLNGADRITSNTHNKDNTVRLILHMDTGRPEDKKRDPILADAGGIVDWQSDIRGMISFSDLNDIKAKEAELARILQRWLAIHP